jgi:hypothetical protein
LRRRSRRAKVTGRDRDVHRVFVPNWCLHPKDAIRAPMANGTMASLVARKIPTLMARVSFL